MMENFGGKRPPGPSCPSPVMPVSLMLRMPGWTKLSGVLSRYPFTGHTLRYFPDYVRFLEGVVQQCSKERKSPYGKRKAGKGNDPEPRAWQHHGALCRLSRHGR